MWPTQPANGSRGQEASTTEDTGPSEGPQAKPPRFRVRGDDRQPPEQGDGAGGDRHGEDGIGELGFEHTGSRGHVSDSIQCARDSAAAGMMNEACPVDRLDADTRHIARPSYGPGPGLVRSSTPCTGWPGISRTCARSRAG